MFSGTLPTTRVMSDCRCPSKYPVIQTSDATNCISNPGPGRPVTSAYRLRREAFPPQFVNDDKRHTYWISSPGLDSAYLALDLGQTTEVSTLTSKLHLRVCILCIAEQSNIATYTF